MLSAVKQSGGRLTPNGDTLTVEASAPLPADLMALVREHTQALLALLTPPPSDDRFPVAVLVYPHCQQAAFRYASGHVACQNPACGQRMTDEPEEKPMEDEQVKAAIEAQFLMGHWVPSAHWDGVKVSHYSWDVDAVCQQLHVPCNALWDQRVLELEAQGLATFTLYAAPITYDEHGNEQEIPGWRDEPSEQWGEVCISARGVLRLAELYGRPYVKLEESPALLAHWWRVQAESKERLHTPYNREKWECEWPEQAILSKAREAEYWRRWEEEQP